MQARAFDSQGAGAKDSVRGLTLAAILIFALSALIGLSEIYSSPKFSLVDEPTHVDYAWKISHGEIPYAGAPLSPEILEAWSCMGAESIQLPTCGDNAPYSEYPLAGENYNYSHPPLFYATVGLGARIMSALPLGIGFVVAARVMNLLWVIVGQIVLYYALRRWNIGRAVAIAASVLVIAFPPVLAVATKVNPDAASVLAASLTIIVTKKIVAGNRMSPWLLFLLAVLITATKVMNVLPLLGLVMALLCLLPLKRFPEIEWRRAGVVAGAVVAGVIVVYFGWAAFQRGRGVPGWVNPVKGINTRPIEGGPFAEWLSTLLRGFNLAQSAYFDSSVSAWSVNLVVAALGLVSVAFAAGGVLMFDKTDPRAVLAFVLFFGCLVWPTLVQFQAYVSVDRSVGYFFPSMTSRYGIAMTGILVGVVAAVVDNRRANQAFVVLVGTCYLVMLLAVFGLPYVVINH